MALDQAAGILVAISIASSRSLQSTTAKPVICSLVPANGPPVVTLFTGASLKEKYIQVRGTGVLVDPVGKPLLDELRANPGAFYVSLRTTREPEGALTGTIQ